MAINKNAGIIIMNCLALTVTCARNYAAGSKPLLHERHPDQKARYYSAFDKVPKEHLETARKKPPHRTA